MGSGVTGNTADSGSVIQGSIPCSPTKMTIAKKPAPRRPIERRKRDHSTREDLLRVTVEQLNIGGEADIRLESILAEADCSPSSLYHHFGNLRGLLDDAQIVRFSHLLSTRTAIFTRGVLDLKSREELIDYCIRSLDELMAADGPTARSQRVNALGSTYHRPDFAKRMAEAQHEGSEALAAALRVPQLRGLIDESVDLYSLAHWVQGLLFSRVLIELGGDDQLGKNWNQLTKRAILTALFGPEAVAGRL